MVTFTQLNCLSATPRTWYNIFKSYAYFAALLLLTLFGTQSAYSQAVSKGITPVFKPTGGFAIDGDLRAGTPTTAPFTSATGDWLQGTSGTGGYVLDATGAPMTGDSTYHLTDSYTSGDLIFEGGLKKNDNLNDYTWKKGSPSPAKCDINNFLMHVSRDPITNDIWITLAGDRESTNGNSFISIALLQKHFQRNTDGTFTSDAPDATGGRTVGDVQISAEFTGGGSDPNLYLEEWKQQVGGTYMWQAIPLPANTAYGSTNAAALTNVPWNPFGSNSYATNAFIEVSFNISAIYRASSNPCVGSISTMFVMTKSSQSVTADLADFVEPLDINLDITVPAPTANSYSYCVGATIPPLSATGTAGATFTWYSDADLTPPALKTGASYPTVSTATAGVHNFWVTQTLFGCESDPTAVTITVVANPTVYTLSGNSICATAPGTGTLTLSNSQTGVSYQLKKASDNSNEGTAKTGTGSALTWTGLSAGVNYYVQATGAAPTNCTSNTANASITEVANPIVYTLSGNSICADAPGTGTLTLSNSQSGVSYQLKLASDNSNVQAAKNGTTGSSLSWTNLDANVNYYVLATGAAPTYCTSATANAQVNDVDDPTVYTLSGNSICATAGSTGTLTLADSETGVSYQLKLASDNSNVQAPKSGTGNALTWTGLPAKVNYYVLATGPAPTYCTSTTASASISEIANPPAPTLEVDDATCENPNITVTVINPVNPASPAPAIYQYRNNGGAWQVSPVFTLAPGTGYNIQVRLIGSNCESMVTTCPSLGPSLPTQSITSNEVRGTNTITTTARIDSKMKVLAAPNPFTDRVRFTLESGVTGMGSLEIYNTMGQKIATVYRGHVEAGKVLNKEYVVERAFRANLIYVFRVGDQKTTGKLLNW